MGDIRVGTASWTDRTLIDSGWYPPEADNPARRLRFYAQQFPVVEVDATYYALPAEATAEAWAGRTPAGFTFNIKAFSLFTQHPTRIAALPADLREGVPDTGKGTVYLRQVAPAVADQAWDRFLSALGPLRAAGKLGAILMQFPVRVPLQPGRAGRLGDRDQRTGRPRRRHPRPVQQLLPRLRPGQRAPAGRPAGSRRLNAPARARISRSRSPGSRS
jgi:uncharacterized protein YecE (DUF72 family)